MTDIRVREAEPAPPFAAQLMPGGLEPGLAVPADAAKKDGRPPLEAEGPVACPNSELEAAGVLAAGKLGVAAAEAPEADGVPKAPAPKAKGAAIPPPAGMLKRPPDGCESFSAAAGWLLLLLLPQPKDTGAVLAASLKRGGSRAAWLVAAEGSCFEEPLRTGAELSRAAAAAAVAELPAQPCRVSAVSEYQRTAVPCQPIGPISGPPSCRRQQNLCTASDFTSSCIRSRSLWFKVGLDIAEDCVLNNVEQRVDSPVLKGVYPGQYLEAC